MGHLVIGRTDCCHSIAEGIRAILRRWLECKTMRTNIRMADRTINTEMPSSTHGSILYETSSLSLAGRWCAEWSRISTSNTDGIEPKVIRTHSGDGTFVLAEEVVGTRRRIRYEGILFLTGAETVIGHGDRHQSG